MKYGILLVTGSHTHQENYAVAFAARKDCQLIGVSDEADVDPRRRELNERLARAHGIPYIADLKDALDRKDVHVVSICAPPERRARIILRSALAGKQLYLDKPLCPSLMQADSIVAAVKTAGVVSHMFTFIPQPWMQEAKRLMVAGDLGDLRAIHADCLFAKGKPGTATLGTLRREEYPPERQQLVEAKRELDNVGVYPITQVRWLTRQRFKTVYAVTANYFFSEHQQHNVEDFALLNCTLENGLPVTITAGRCGWTSHPAGGVNRMVLVGSKKTIVADASRPRLEVCTDETPWMPPPVNPEDPMCFWQSTQDAVHVRPKRTWTPIQAAAVTDAGYFMDRLAKGEKSDVDAGEAALATEVILAAYKSAATGEVVTLPLPR